MNKENKKPSRKTQIRAFGNPDYTYVSEMLDWYESESKEISLKDFTYTEIQSNETLFAIYIENLKKSQDDI